MNLNIFDPNHPWWPQRWLLTLSLLLILYNGFINLNHRTFFGDGNDAEAALSGPNVQGFNHK